MRYAMMPTRPVEEVSPRKNAPRPRLKRHLRAVVCTCGKLTELERDMTAGPGLQHFEGVCPSCEAVVMFSVAPKRGRR